MQKPDFSNRPEPERLRNELPANHLTIWVAGSAMPTMPSLTETPNAPPMPPVPIAGPVALAASRKGGPPLNLITVRTRGAEFDLRDRYAVERRRKSAVEGS